MDPAARSPDSPERIAAAAATGGTSLRLRCSVAAGGGEGGAGSGPVLHDLRCTAELHPEVIAAAAGQLARSAVEAAEQAEAGAGAGAGTARARAAAPRAAGDLAGAPGSTADAEAPQARLELVRADCSVCPLAREVPEAGADSAAGAGRSIAGLDRAVARAEQLVDSAGLNCEIVQVEQPLREGGARPRRWQRGALFSALRRRRDPAELQPVRPVSVPAISPERGVLLAALPRATVPVPAPSRRGCTACRACEQVCPTEAIMWRATERVTDFGVVPMDCVACGLCVQTCPEDVLELTGQADVGGPVQVLHRVITARCERCDAALSPGERDRCTRCTTGTDLLDEVWSQL
ncbi:4Fe-4S dicluster domain-containing protein [Brachybacterium sp. Marseille-Q7125]|uniref:4Fe-4S dicluster domain-containing protein n=1 Tax=Brachybacterium sp. Marseille-Q7125 TaxID=2932815 RepID=UPI001FF5E150|nr:4Fe-4S dicluster domain-containing protein [Brachybacterium sp. Marseille-Q7125]